MVPTSLLHLLPAQAALRARGLPARVQAKVLAAVAVGRAAMQEARPLQQAQATPAQS